MRQVGNESELQVSPPPGYQVTLHNENGSQAEFCYVYKYFVSRLALASSVGRERLSSLSFCIS